ncbi:MAG: hypothetical protein GY771_12440 [bacterium]|nr:hypothetical protein [bacterium]
MNDPRGSIWRKWDLHVHTPCSFEQEYGGDNEKTWDKYLEEIEAKAKLYNIEAIGITDYYTIDGYRKIKEHQNKGFLRNILLLPNIEFRLDISAKEKKLNYHVLFSGELSLETIENDFLGELHFRNADFENDRITKDKIEELGQKIKGLRKSYNIYSDYVAGAKSIYVSLEEIIEILEFKKSKFDGQYLLILAEAVWSDIKWEGQKILQRKNTLLKSHALFSSSKKTELLMRGEGDIEPEKMIKEFGGIKPCLWGSDAHKYERLLKPDLDRFCWIKGDLTFEGLKQVIYEPKERVFIGKEPPIIERFEGNKTKYIESIEIRKKENVKGKETWFDCEIPFNKGLVSIIGNKGSGKSALVDIIGLLGNSENYERFSFLTEKKFKHPRDGLSKDYYAQIAWADGSRNEKCLSEPIDENDIPLVKYIPQKFFEDICTEIASGEDTEFRRELEDVIFSHVRTENRLGCNSLSEIVDLQTKQIYQRISSINNKINTINLSIIDYENKATSKYKTKLTNLLDVKKDELIAIDSSKPKEVKKPKRDEGYDKTIDDKKQQIKEKKEALELIKRKQTEYENGLKSINGKIQVCISSLDRINNLRNYVLDEQKEIEKTLSKLGIKFVDIVQFEVNTTLIEEKKKELIRKKGKIEKALTATDESSLERKIEEIELGLAEHIQSLDKKDIAYEKYLSELKKWGDRKNELIGSSEINGTIKYFENEIKLLNEIPSKLKKSKKNRDNLTTELYSNLEELKTIMEELYGPVQSFINDHEVIRDRLEIQFGVSIEENRFDVAFLNHINRSSSRIFSKSVTTEKSIQQLREKYDFNEQDNILTFIEGILEGLGQFEEDVSTSVPVDEKYYRLRKDKNRLELYNFLYSLEYLKPRFVLTLGGKKLHRLTPGERGALLIIFYLLVDKIDTPLLIDQPEENLDNETVFELLVESIKEAKKRRQIFIVTHNPNLTVVCDAEQVIRATHKTKPYDSIQYESGGIENPRINKAILNVLEGTRPAFVNRRLKYHDIDNP